MTDEISSTSQHATKGKTTRRIRKAELRVVFDTNALYVISNSVGSASDLVRQEILDLITTAEYPDLEIAWYLPEVVRHERQYQMQSEALKLRAAINKIERLLSHNLALTDEMLIDHVARKIEEKEKELGLVELSLDHSQVNWTNVIRAATYRLPPFQPGEKEKGFRDAIVAEAFMQLVARSPKTARVCRLILVTSDDLLRRAVEVRISGLSNVAVLSNIEELKGLINTLISNVDEDFIAALKPKAEKLFFSPDQEEEGLYYKEKIGDRIRQEFKALLSERPENTVFRTNGTWYVAPPNFARKDGKRVFWTSRITIEVEAGRITREDSPPASKLFINRSKALQSEGTIITSDWLPMQHTQPQLFVSNPTDVYLTGKSLPLTAQIYAGSIGAAQKKLVTQKGEDVYEVLWSTEVTVSRELKKPQIELIKHVELSCQAVA